MLRTILSFAILAFGFSSVLGQIAIRSNSGNYDTIFSGDAIYYQYSWDEPLQEERDSFAISTGFRAFGTQWDSAVVSDGSLLLVSKSKPNVSLIIDATGWDLMDKGWEDTINYPNLSPVIISSNLDEVEWRDFGFAKELDSLFELPSTGSVKIKFNQQNKIDLIYGEFSMIRPDLAFEGFGSLRPSVTYIDEAFNTHTWFIYGNPDSPSIDSFSTDTAFDHLPVIGTHIGLDFNQTNFVKRNGLAAIKVYPNPAKQQIQMAGAQDYSGFSFKVVSIDGLVVQSGSMTSNTIDIRSLNLGYYVLHLMNNDKHFYSKFLKITE